MPLLRLDHVSKRYRRGRVVSDVTLEVDAGDFLLVTGPNGAGKTTLLRLMSGFVPPSTGTVTWLGDGAPRPMTDPGAKRGLGVVGHQPFVYHELSPREHLEFARRLRGAQNGTDSTHEWLGRFGLRAAADAPAGQLSRGQRQRLALAAAFSVQPKLLLLDEPMADLDEAGRGLLLGELARVRSGAGIVVAAHEAAPFGPLVTRRLLVEAGLAPVEASP